MLSLNLNANKFAPGYYNRRHSPSEIQFSDNKWKKIFENLRVDPLVDNVGGILRFDIPGKKIDKYILKRIKSGISPEIRGLYWKCIAQTETFKNYLPNDLYSHLIFFPATNEDKEIKLDIGRTIYYESLSENTTSLFNVLRAYKLYNPDVGYCQGMGYIVGMLLTQMGEEDAFYTLISMMEKYNLQEMYRPGLPALGHMCNLLELSVKKTLPKLYYHFINEKVNISMYAVQWFMTLFTYNTTLERAAPIWDLFYIRGIDSLQTVALSLLKHLEPKLLQLSIEPLINKLVCLDDVDMMKVVKSAIRHL